MDLEINYDEYGVGYFINENGEKVQAIENEDEFHNAVCDDIRRSGMSPREYLNRQCGW